MNLTLLGKVAAHYEGREVAFTTRKCRALLGYLALSDAAEETRERLIGLLWSETEEERARGSLRQALYELRASLEGAGLDVLSATKVAVTLDRTKIKVDAWAVLEEAKAGRAHPLLLETERLADTLLAEFETIDPAFRVWLLAKRQTLHDRLVRYLEQAMREDRAYAAKADLARALLNLDPTHEEAARLLIRLRVEVGDVGGALAIYKRLWDLLEEEYDVEPSKETQDLIAAIRLAQPLGEAPPISGAQGPETTAIPTALAEAARQPSLGEPPRGIAIESVAQEMLRRPSAAKLVLSVADFSTAGISEDSIHLVQGFRRELIACLVRFREWAVRDLSNGWSSQAAAASTAEYVIEADAMRSGEGVRLVLTLREVATGDFLWSHRLQISIDAWFHAQQLVVRHIATALNVHVSVERLSRITSREVLDLKAYDLWLLGQSTILSFDPRNWEKAAELFRQVVERMPHFAPAYSSLAQLGNTDHIVLPGMLRDAARTARSLDYAREAARLDPIDSRSQLCLAWSHALSRQYDQALIHAPLACELNDNDPWTRVSAANCFAFLGETKRAHTMVEEALALPLAPSPIQWSYYTAIRFMEGDYQGCIAAAQSAGDANPNVPGYKASSLYHVGEREAAREEYKRFCDVIRSRWVGKEPATEQAITRWFLTMFPIRHTQDWERLRDGLAGAGAPVRDLAHERI